MAIDWVAVQAALHEWVVGATSLAEDKVVWGGQDAPRPEGVAVTMLIPNISEMGQPWQELREQPLVLDAVTVEFVDPATNTFTATGHPFQTGDGPVLVASDAAVPDELPDDGRVWIVRVDDDHFRVAETFFDAMSGQPDAPTPNVIDITSAGSGTITVETIADSLRAGEELRAVSAGMIRLTLELRCHSASVAAGAIATGNDMAMAVLQRVRSRRYLPSQQAILDDANLSVLDIDRIRSVQGIRDAMLFEPRAYLDIHICVPFEEYEDLTIIERALVTNLLTGVETTISVDDTFIGAPFAAFTATVNLNRVEFEDLSSSSEGITAWLWDFGDGQLSMLEDPVHLYDGSGNYAVTLTVTDGAGRTSTASLTLTAGEAVSLTTFRYVATGGEHDFMVALPAPQPTDTYSVTHALAGVAQVVDLDCPDLLPGDRTSTEFRVVATAPLTAGDQIDFVIT